MNARLAFCLALSLSAPLTAQSFLGRIKQAPARARAVQPQLACTISTLCPILTQGLKEQFSHQNLGNGTHPWNLGGGFGPSFVVSSRLMVGASIPAYLLNGTPAKNNGFGDVSILTQTRLFSGNRDHGNYSLNAAMLHTWTTGSIQNGSPSATTTYFLTGAKAFGPVNFQSAESLTRPAASGVALIGHPVGWNAAVQYHATRLLYANVESNTTFFNGGPYDGKVQNFVNPGLILWAAHPSFLPKRNRLTFGASMQIATTHFHTSNHNLILDSKVSF